MRKFRASHKIAIGFALIALVGVYGYRYANDFLLGREHFAPLQPGVIDIVGLDTKAGYGIIIENRVAKLVYAGANSFGPGKMGETDLQNAGGDRKFIPIKDMLSSLQGNVQGMSVFVERLNDITAADDHPYSPVWKAEDIQKALDGDAALRAKLVHDLNMNLDGTPLNHLLPKTVQNGILVETPVSMTMGDGKPVIARVKRSYSPIFMNRLLERLKDKFYTPQMEAQEYANLGQAIATKEVPKEDIAASLKGLLKAADLATFPQRILNSITVVLNENQITGATSSTSDTPKGKVYNLIINLSDEGSKRLWQFARDHEGDQLLLTVNGVAIAAPFIDHATDLGGGQIEIKGMEDDSIVQDAVSTINEKKATTSQ